MPQNERRRILVTGVADFVAAEVVRQLEGDERVGYIAGIDFRETRRAFQRAEIINGDLRCAGLKYQLESMRPDTIVHLQWLRSNQDAAPQMREVDVAGTTNLATSAAALPFVRKLVMASALQFEGAGSADLAEMESAVNRLAGEGGKSVTVLRFADIIGPGINNRISRYLRMPIVPTVAAFDPMLQFCHERDAVEVVKRAALLDLPGIFNVAGDGVVYLSRALRLGGAMSWAVAPAFAPALFSTLGALGMTDVHHYYQLLLRCERAIDNQQLKTRFGFIPRYSTLEAVLDLYGKSTVSRARREAAAPAEEQKSAAA